ncbi:MAG: carbohydrate binding family 9 domain-containing protein [Ignavibacteria bacterium]|nr:carbohydrate binding family 9 domain-containing protein [Ignavibacteria bacterium]
MLFLYPIKLDCNIFKHVLIIILFVITLNSFGQNKTIEAVFTSEPPSIDGYLDDSVWSKAKSISDFLQQEPVPGKQASLKTEVKILYDYENLYVGVMCYDNQPEKIIARELKWDGRMSGDDNFTLLFDTFNDNRTAYWFGTNPLGMHDDALLQGFDYSGFNESWNGIWDVRSKIIDSGWSIEFIFPFSTFKFKDTDEQIWGINFQREIKRLGETVLWTSVGADKGFFKLPYAGDLIGLKHIKRGNPIYLKPFFTFGTQKEIDSDRKFIYKPGLDIKYGLTDNLSLDITFNTDFAQVESDRAVINLTRFPLVYPEKRSFFLEGADIFSFTHGASNNLFYSRRIGLSERAEEIPIIAGAKLVGRVGKFQLGLLDIQTSKKEKTPATNYFALRSKYDLLEQSFIGFIFTNKMSKGFFSRTFGGDITFNFNNFLGDKNLTIGFGLMKTDDTSHFKNSWATKFWIDYPNDLIDQFFSYRLIQANFDPQMGFIKRKGIQSYTYNLEINPRLNWNGVKKLNFKPIESVFNLDGNGKLIEASLQFQPFGFTTVAGDRFETYIKRVFDRVEADYTIFNESHTITMGDYWFTTLGAEFKTSAGRDIYGELDYQWGNFYTGKIKTFETNVTFVINRHISITSDFQHNHLRMDSTKFSTNEFGGRIRFDFSTSINSSIFAQWNNEDEELNVNFRFNWQPKIGSDFYLVINQQLSTQGKIRTKDFALLAKIVWMFII